MDDLCLWNRERQTFGGRNAAKGAVVTLEELDVPPMGGRCYCDNEVINVGEDQPLGDAGVVGGDVDNEQKGRDRGVLWGAHSYR